MKVFHELSRMIFPTWCELCGGGGDHVVCQSCEEDLQRMDPPYCLICSEKMSSPNARTQDCHHCRDTSFSFDYIVASYQMNEPLRDLIHALKYKRALYISTFLGKRMKLAFLDSRLADLDLSEWVITSVPLHFTRQRQRYFNQSEILAKALAKEINTPYHKLLKRIRPTEQQIRLTKFQRAKNVAKAFTSLKGSLPKKVILVDDVFTTGSTVNECAKVLRKEGVEIVIVICLARK